MSRVRNINIIKFSLKNYSEKNMIFMIMRQKCFVLNSG